MKKRQIKFNILLTLMVVLTFSCTDLKIEETDSIFLESEEGGFAGVADVESSLTNLYAGVRGQVESHEALLALNGVSSDELIIPTRGTDWGDNGIWRTLQSHTWGPTHLFILNTWNNFNQNAFLANEIIDSRSNPSTEQLAEAKFLRAFNMSVIMDMFGQVPFREVDEGPDVNPKVLTRTEALAFIMQDLDDAIAGLPSRAPGDTNNKAGIAAAKFLKARILLNKHIYNGSGSADSGDMTAVISLVDDIAAEGYALVDGYFDIFKEDVDNETIWFTKSSTGNRMWSGLHYNQITPDNTGGGWNGFSTLADFYDSFEGPVSNAAGQGQEERRGWVPDATNTDDTNYGLGFGFLIGQQAGNDGSPLKDRAGAPLVYTKEFVGLVGNSEREGVRILKYHPANGAFVSHVIVFRYADAHLMKAEAMLRSGGDATAMVNELRALRGASDLGAVSESDMLAERGRELYQESIRRVDLIRFGEFTSGWEFIDAAAVGDESKNLFPIPTNALLSNPNLVQNPGY